MTLEDSDQTLLIKFQSSEETDILLSPFYYNTTCVNQKRREPRVTLKLYVS